MLETGIRGSRLRHRLLGFVLGAAVGVGVLATTKRAERQPLVFYRDAYSLPLFIQCASIEACDGPGNP